MQSVDERIKVDPERTGVIVEAAENLCPKVVWHWYGERRTVQCTIYFRLVGKDLQYVALYL